MPFLFNVVGPRQENKDSSSSHRTEKAGCEHGGLGLVHTPRTDKAGCENGGLGLAVTQRAARVGCEHGGLGLAHT